MLTTMLKQVKSILPDSWRECWLMVDGLVQGVARVGYWVFVVMGYVLALWGFIEVFGEVAGWVWTVWVGAVLWRAVGE